MESRSMSVSLKIMIVVSFFVMILVNALANLLPINGMDTGAVSDAFPNLFAPAGITFAIWGLIYLLLAGYVLYQTVFTKGAADSAIPRTKIGILFSASSIANALWIFAWHYQRMPVTLALMLVILICLILINLETRQAKLTKPEAFLIRLPFSVYFGWITVAAIANTTVLLVSLGWKGLGLSETLWTIGVLAVGILIGTSTVINNRDAAYGLVFIWAYIGIIIKHTSPEGFAGKYSAIIGAAVACIVWMLAAEIYMIFRRKKKSVL